ncbi:TRAP transporter substrate-binding protein [Terrabacter sp. GCM10012305]
MAAVVLGLAGCASSTPNRAGGRGLQEVTVLEIAQLNDVAPTQVRAYAAEVEKQSHGSLSLDFNDNWHKGEIDFEKHTLEDVTSGRMPGAWVGVRALDLIGVTSFQPLVAPLLVDSQAMQERIFSEGIPLEMAGGLEGHGLVAVAVLPGPMRKVLGVRKPFRERADFRDSDLGIQGGEIPEATAIALGATFTRMPSGASLAGADAYEQQVENVFGTFYGLEAKYVTANVNLWPQVMVVVLNEASYRALTDAQREVLRTAATNSVPAALAATRRQEDAAVAKLCEQQVAFPLSSDLQLAALRHIVQTVYDEIADNPDNARMLDRLTVLRAAVAAPPDVSTCPSPRPDDGRGSFPEGTYDMVLANDLRSQCTDGSAQGTPGRQSWFSLEVRGDRVTMRQRIDSQTAPEQVGHDMVYRTMRDQVEVGNLTARWSFDGTALRLSDMSGGSCGDAVIWTTNPWVLRSGPVHPVASVVPEGTYETVLSTDDRHLCDGQPEEVYLNPWPEPPPTWYVTFTLEGGAVREYESEVSPAASGILGWVGSYRVYGNTFELTDLTLVQHMPPVPAHRDLLTATFTFDGTTLTLTPVGSWPCESRVLWTLHPWTLTRKAP